MIENFTHKKSDSLFHSNIRVTDRELVDYMELLYSIDRIDLNTQFQKGENYEMMNIVKTKLSKDKKSGYRVNCKSPLAFNDCLMPNKEEVNNPIFIVYMGLSD